MFYNNLKLEAKNFGEQSGQWGNTNANLELIGEALGYGTKVGFSSDADNTNFALAILNSDKARAMYLKLTSGASLTQTRAVLQISHNQKSSNNRKYLLRSVLL